MKERIDKVLLKKDMVSSRSQARLLVEEGVVFCDGKLIKKSGQLVDEFSNIEVRKDVLYVGRGAHKIEKALYDFNLNTADMTVADVGASTGGFTDYVLKNGAAKVYAIDVGHDQLSKCLKEDSRVVNMEGINIRYPLELDEKVDLVVADLSYISLKLTLDTIFSLAKDFGNIVTLVKPQFEAGKERVGKNGIVKSDNVRLQVLEELYDWCTEKKYYIKGASRSPIKGKDGNVEYFFYFVKGSKQSDFLKHQLTNV